MRVPEAGEGGGDLPKSGFLFFFPVSFVYFCAALRCTFSVPPPRCALTNNTSISLACAVETKSSLTSGDFAGGVGVAASAERTSGVASGGGGGGAHHRTNTSGAHNTAAAAAAVNNKINNNNNNNNRGLVSELLAVARQGGLRSLYAGWVPRAVRAGPTCGIVLVAYEMAKNM